MYFFFLATAYEGAMADINTYDQPGVEDYKKILRKYLQKYMDKIIKQISEEILSGEINIKPSYNLKLQKGKTPCEYCKYKSICKFDANNKGNDYNYIGTLNKEAILDMIKEQTDV